MNGNLKMKWNWDKYDEKANVNGMGKTDTDQIFGGCQNWTEIVFVCFPPNETTGRQTPSTKAPSYANESSLFDSVLLPTDIMLFY